MKLCKDCKHFQQTMPQCHAPKNMKLDYVTGEKTAHGYSTAQGARYDPDACGSKGKWFEQKERE